MAAVDKLSSCFFFSNPQNISRVLLLGPKLTITCCLLSSFFLYTSHSERRRCRELFLPELPCSGRSPSPLSPCPYIVLPVMRGEREPVSQECQASCFVSSFEENRCESVRLSAYLAHASWSFLSGGSCPACFCITLTIEEAFCFPYDQTPCFNS